MKNKKSIRLKPEVFSEIKDFWGTRKYNVFFVQKIAKIQKQFSCIQLSQVEVFKPQIWTNRPEGRGIENHKDFLITQFHTKDEGIEYIKPNLSNKNKKNAGNCKTDAYKSKAH